MGELLGLAVLIGVGAAATLVILSAVIARDAVRPPRHTAGYAVARGLATDPGEMGLEYDEWALDLPDGATLPVWEIAGAGGDGPTAVFVHDWGESRIDVLAAIGPWMDTCSRIVLHDLRGHGEATGGVSRLGTAEHRDLLALLERLGDGPFVLVGRGLGAEIVKAAAAEAPPGRIADVVTRAPRGDLRTWLRRRHPGLGLCVDLALVWLRLAGVRGRPRAPSVPVRPRRV